jgi:hypothetical protein
MVEQAEVQGIDLIGGRPATLRETRQPEGDVVGMSIEILRGMDETPKGILCQGGVLSLKGEASLSPVQGDVLQAGGEGIGIEMEFIVTDLTAEGILPQVGGDNSLEGQATEIVLQGLDGNLTMNRTLHFIVIP